MPVGLPLLLGASSTAWPAHQPGNSAAWPTTARANEESLKTASGAKGGHKALLVTLEPLKSPGHVMVAEPQGKWESEIVAAMPRQMQST